MLKIIFATIFLIAANPVFAESVCYTVEGMTCLTCPLTVKAAIKKLNGINNVKVSLEERNAVIEFDSKKSNSTQIEKAIDDTGYKASPLKCTKQ